MRKRRSALLATFLIVVVVAGCTTTSEGSPEPVPTTDRPAETTSANGGPEDRELPYAGAPAVDNPLDTTRYQRDPCQALTAAQAQELNVRTPGEPYDDSLGKSCHFAGKSDAQARVDVGFFDQYPFGLSATYQAHEDGKYDFFNPLPPIEGYPAVARAGTDDRDDGACAVEVGTSDEISFEIALRLSAANVGTLDPCDTAAMVAGMVLQTMKADS
jgi:hypothetical protein